MTMRELNAEAHAWHEQVRARRRHESEVHMVARAIGCDGSINLIVPWPGEGVPRAAYEKEPYEIMYDPHGDADRVFIRGWFSLLDLETLVNHMGAMRHTPVSNAEGSL